MTRESMSDVTHWIAVASAEHVAIGRAQGFTQGRSNWGYAFRFGLFKVTADDTALIARAMSACPAT